MPLTLRLLTLALLLTVAAPAWAHIRLDEPPMRYEYSFSTQKQGPCGGGVATGQVTTFAPGDTITVRWTETINHPGHFRIALDPTGTDAFVDPSSETDMAVTGNIIAYVPDTGGSQFEYTFTLPNQECARCSLQLIQVMTDKLGNGWGNDDIYYWCADISIQQPTGTGGTGGNAGFAGGPSGGTSSGGFTAGGSGGTLNTGGLTAGGTGGLSAGGSGGTLNNGGSPAMGGVANAGGSSLGGASNGTGGSAKAGTGGAGSGSGGTSTAPTSQAEDEGGCSVAGGRTASTTGFLGLLLLSTLAWRRRGKPATTSTT